MTVQPVPARDSRSPTTVAVESDPRWADLVRSRPSDVFHSPAWAAVLGDAYGFEVQANLLLDDAGGPRGGMPFVVVDDARGRRVVSLPFSDFCDPIADDGADWQRLTDALPIEDTPARNRCLRSRPPSGSGWRQTGSFAWHRVDTGRPPSEAWEAIHPSARRAVRKAQAAGVVVTEARTEADLRAFFHLHLRVRKYKYELLAQPFGFFAAIWERFIAPGAGHLLLAKVGGHLVGGVLFLEWKDTLYYKFNASRTSDLGARPNDLIVWEGMHLAHERGLRWLDFGVSDLHQEGLIRFKRKYATDEGEVVALAAGPELPDPVGPLLGGITRLLVEPSVPDVVTERAGEELYALFA